MLLAVGDISKHISDHPWVQVDLWGMTVTLMSSRIAAMLLAGALVLLLILPLARRYSGVPKGGRNVLEVLVLFVRDWIAKPALHDKFWPFMPYLLTMFCFILAMNLVGMTPLLPVLELAGLPIGGAATGILAVCGGLALLSMMTIIVLALRAQTLKARDKYHIPIALAAALSPLLWIKSFAPQAPGIVGYILVVPLTILEFVGVFAKCFALMIRLFANMISGHTLLAVLAALGLSAAAGVLQDQIVSGSLVGLVCLAASVALDLMELLVALVQAYVFTFLTAMFLALYVDPSH